MHTGDTSAPNPTLINAGVNDPTLKNQPTDSVQHHAISTPAVANQHLAHSP